MSDFVWQSVEVNRGSQSAIHIAGEIVAAVYEENPDLEYVLEVKQKVIAYLAEHSPGLPFEAVFPPDRAVAHIHSALAVLANGISRDMGEAIKSVSAFASLCAWAERVKRDSRE